MMKQHLYSKIIFIAIAALFFYFTPQLAFAQEEILPQEQIVDQIAQYLTPGSTQGTGTNFEIKDSEYLNIFLESDREITIEIESIPSVVSLKIASSTDFNSAQLTIRGLEPQKTYYKYRDSHQTAAVFVSDENGAFSWTQDLAEPHHVWFMERKGTIYIGSDTTLTSDLNETVEITASNVTLDCDNHQIIGPTGSGYAIYVNNKNNVTIKNCRASNFSYGVYFVFNFSGSVISDNIFSGNQTGIRTEGNSGWFKPSISILNNKVYDNWYEGIFTRYCIGNQLSGNEIYNNPRLGLYIGECTSTLRNNSLHDNKYNFGVYGIFSGLEQDIDISNTVNGKPIYYLVREKDKTIDSDSNAGYIGVVNSENILVKDVEINNNWHGIFFDNNKDSKIENARVSGNQYGVEMNRCVRCDISKSEAAGNDYGIKLWLSSFAAIKENNILNNRLYGLYLTGMWDSYSHDNKIFHNNFISNNVQIDAIRSINDSFDDGYPAGGNYFSDYRGVDLMSGPNQDQPGADGIGDTPHTFYGGEQDKYPLMKPAEINPPTEPKPDWSFAVISDLHVGQEDFNYDYGDPTWDDANSLGNNGASAFNLKNTVELLNSKITKYDLKFVVVTGDFSDSGELSELNKAKEILNTLEIPWIPIIGNHDVWPYYGIKFDLINREGTMAPEITNGNGTDKYFYDLFSEQYQKLANTFQNWEKQSSPSWNYDVVPFRDSYFENFAFDYNSYHFIGLDFNDREIEDWPAKGAAAEGNLHDFSDGTWQWFSQHLLQYVLAHPADIDKIILLAHHPFGKDYWKSFYDFKFYNIGFSDDELKTIRESLIPYSENLYALFSGHTHKNRSYSLGALPIIETGANVDGPLARIVRFYSDNKIDYSRMIGAGMIITAHSPIDLEVTDSNGLLINKSTNGIPGASYFEEDLDGDGDVEDQIQIPERVEGDYQIRVIPEPGAAPDDTYSLDVSLLEDNFGYTPIILAQDVPVGQIPDEPYIFQAQERAVTNIAYGGDLSGQYSDSINLSAILTDADGNPLVDKNILFEIGEQSISAVTDSGGTANASLVLNQIPGQYYSIETSFAGDEDYLPATDIKDFEILKEDVAINVSEKGGFAFDDVVLEVEIKDGDGQLFLQEAQVEFKIDSRDLGMVPVGENGVATSTWRVDLIPKEITENYPIDVIFAGNDYYQPAQGQANFVLRSAKWLKQDALSQLGAIQTNDRKLNLEIQAAKRLIQDSLSENLWIDASRLIFFEGGCLKKNQADIEPEKIDAESLFETGRANGLGKNCFWIRSGLRVFGDEYLAVKILQKKIFGEPIIDELVSADELLAKVAVYDAQNSAVENQKFQEIVDRQIAKAQERLARGQEISDDQPAKAIANFAISWLRARLVMKFASL